MAILADIVKNVLVIVLIASFMELMLPEGTLKPFVRFAMGLFILIAVLNPVAGLLFSEHDLTIQWWDYQVSPEQQERILQQGEEVNRQIWESNQQSLSPRMEGQIGAVAMLVPGVDDVEVRVDLDKSGMVQALQLTVTIVSPAEEVGAFSNGGPDREAADQEAIRRKLTGILQNLYGFEDKAIQIEFKGG